MQFHQQGYVSTDPQVWPAAGSGVDRPDELPDLMDVLIVGAGPAGHIIGAQLAQFPSVLTRLIERRGGRLERGHADGIQARTVETFQAFGFAQRLMEEAYTITAMAFWAPDPQEPSRIVRTSMPADDPAGMSEFPHLILNQARVQDYFAEVMLKSPTRMRPDFGWEFLDLEIADHGDHPVTVHLRGSAFSQAGHERTVKAKYVVGCDGARSTVRAAIGRSLVGDQAMRAWGVMDVLAVTDFPDIRTKCDIQSSRNGNILLIPREGGYLFRMYVDLGAVGEDDNGAVRSTTVGEIIDRANHILHPYSIDVRHVIWHTVYEVAHRLADRFDDLDDPGAGIRAPRVFIAGDACHTHSAQAGQGMNVSMQDGFNLAWKLGHVLDGRSPESLLATYSAERQVVAKDLIEFDKQWSTLMATPVEELDDRSAVEEFYTKTFEFPSGFMTRYAASVLIAQAIHQKLAPGFPIGKRFKSSPVVRVCDTNPVQLGHQARADGRWRIYVFADAASPGQPSPLTDLAQWMQTASDSPVNRTPSELDVDAWFDLRVIYQQSFAAIDVNKVPRVFRPTVGKFQLTDLEKVYAAGARPDGRGTDIFDEREIDRGGVIVVVRPDMYVANLLPLDATTELTTFFEPIVVRRATELARP
ncbi:MAG: FAD-dependent monooxygenase [Acidimicrobiales bacterium]